MALSGVGFLKRVTDNIGLYGDDSGASSRFSDANLLAFVRRAWADVMSDINRVSAFKPRARVTIQTTTGQREYALPPNITQFLEFRKEDDDGDIEWEVTPDHPLNVRGRGFTIENGLLLRFNRMWRRSDTMVIVYVPSAETLLFEGTGVFGENVVTDGLFASSTTWTYGAGWAHDAVNRQADHSSGTANLSQAGILTDARQYGVTFTVSNRTAGSVTPYCGSGGAGTARSTNATFAETITCSGSTDLLFTPSNDFDGSVDTVIVQDVEDTSPAEISVSSVTDGTQDARDYIYLGYMLRVIDASGNPIDQRMVTGYSGGIFTVTPDFALRPTNTTVELLPAHSYRFEDIIALRAARFIASVSVDVDRRNALLAEYKDALRTMRLDLAQGEQRIGRRMHRTTRGKIRRLGQTG